MPLDPEQMFQKLQNREWLDFLGILHTNKIEIPKSPIATQAISHFIKEYESELGVTSTGDQIDVLEKIYLFHIGKIYKFPDAIIHKIVDLKMEFYRSSKPKDAYRLACQWKERPLSKEIIDEYLEDQPVSVNHSRNHEIRVTENKLLTQSDLSIPLFKSNQEYEFFSALVSYYPNFHTYPNVAVSCLIDFEKIKPSLSSDQRNYFLKSIIDCVVFDPRDKYRPLFFFEIDSKYHDTEEQQKKDRWKDRFFSLAGRHLYRIRPLSKDVGREEFKELINELVGKGK